MFWSIPARQIIQSCVRFSTALFMATGDLLAFGGGYLFADWAAYPLVLSTMTQ